VRRLADFLARVRDEPRHALPVILADACVEHGGTFIPETEMTHQPWPADCMATVHLLEVTGFGASDEAACADWIKAAERVLEAEGVA